MKKILSVILSLIVIFSLTACNKEDKSMRYNYDFEALSEPFWNTNIVYNESILLSEDDNGDFSGKLMMEPTKVISVRDYTLNLVYEEGKDYTRKGDTFYAKKDSELITYFTKDNMKGIGIDDQTIISNVIVGENPRDILFTSSYQLFINQIFVTYQYDITKYSIPKPQKMNDKLPALANAIEKKQDLTMLVLGDSISGGGQSSSNGNLDPFCPDWVDIYGKAIENKINNNGGNAIVSVINKSMGGMMSDYSINMSYSVDGVNNLAKYHTKREQPDIVMIAYGMNDGTWGVTADKLYNNIKKTMEDCQSVSDKQLEFIVVGTMMPNDNGGGWLNANGIGGTPCYGLQPTYDAKLKTFAEDFDNVAYVNMSELQDFVLKNKKFEDITVNNLNHPNDFFIRAYAMNLIDATLR